MTELSRWTLTHLKLILNLVIIVGVALAYLLIEPFHARVNYAAMMLSQGDVGALRDYILSFGAWAPLMSALLMVLQALAAPLPAFLLAFANGLAFGTFWGGLLTYGSALLAAAISFWLARTLGRGPIEFLIGKSGLAAADRWFARRGASAVLVARLIPVVSFDAISFAAGLTGVRFWPFLGATAVGMFPATFVYAYLGDRAPQLIRVLLVAFAVVAVGGALLALVRWWHGRRAVQR